MTEFIETENNFITPTSGDKEQKASSSPPPSSISWPTKRHYPIIWDLYIKGHFLVKTQNVQNSVYTDHILDPALTLQSKQKAREYFQIRIPWHGLPLLWPTTSFPQALISANFNNPDLTTSLPAAAQFTAGFDRGLQHVRTYWHEMEMCIL